MKKNVWRCERKRKWLRATTMIVITSVVSNYCMAQDGTAGINQVTTMVKGYFDSGANLMYAIGAILTLRMEWVLQMGRSGQNISDEVLDRLF